MTTIVDRTDSPAAADRIRDDDFLADKKRFESFKLGGAIPSSQTRRHSHSRSHSRNLSVSIPSSPSLPLSFPSLSHDISLSSTSSSISSLASAPTKRSSHHRRCSSVSTRRESAEVMGVTLPALPASISEDNMALGDKDSIRRRALWALEGKPSPDGFSPVEIPELSTPEIERRIFELPSKPSFPPAMGSFSSGLSGLANLRDTFGNRMSSSIKDQLHTLVEEEEEEEDPDVPSSPPILSPCESPEAVALPGSVTTSPTPTRTRPRPAGLTLRPLSLSPEKFKPVPNGELSTSAPTSTPSKSSGLKSLTLTSSPNLVSSPPTLDGVLSEVSAIHRRSGVVPPSYSISSTPFFRRASLTDSTFSGFSDPFELPKKRSSISYKSSFHGLPTPELTPTTDRRASTGSDSDWGRPSSITHEQHFLYQSQAALVARISELERTLSSRTHSRPVSSTASDASSSAPEPSDGMVRLISDLKAEREELKRDINGWRTRVADLERQTGALALRVDTERREAWIARERLGLIEMEKRAALRVVEESEVTVVSLQAELATTKADFQAAQEVVERSREEVARELDRVRATLLRSVSGAKSSRRLWKN
ncbi:hypothetical protein BGW80DRAFT_675171 [Lactifluus volemus]|nr:hypothetical protein BGW80DRAFT_675171 [Lactifluus volemus]